MKIKIFEDQGRFSGNLFKQIKDYIFTQSEKGFQLRLLSLSAFLNYLKIVVPKF